MKAERRHELQTNTLAQFLTDLPLYLRFHANKILIGVIVICLIILLVRHRTNTAAAAKETARSALQSAKMGVEQLRSIDRTQPNDVARAQERRKLIGQINDTIENQVMPNATGTDEAAMRADALLTQADMYWTLANLPTRPGAASQPSLAMQSSPADYLNNADGAYSKLLSPEYDSQKMAKAAALLGLAAIEENRGNWDKASSYYNSVSNDPDIARVFKGVASQRVAIIPQIRMPVYMGSFSSTQPATEPSSQPATMPVQASTPATTEPAATTKPQ